MTFLISADEQAILLRRLMPGELPFSAEKVRMLREIMRVRATDKSQLFGKTGTGKLADDIEQVACLVGWVESGTDGKTRTIAYVARDNGLTGLNAPAMVPCSAAWNVRRDIREGRRYPARRRPPVHLRVDR